MPRTKKCRTRRALLALTLLGLTPLATGVARAQTAYKLQQIARLGERAGDTLLPSGEDYGFGVGGLNDSGQLLFDAVTITDGKSDLLLQYTDGKFTRIATVGMDGPVGKWPEEFHVDASMNQSGNVVFVGMRFHPFTILGTFLWDAKARQITAVALPGMPATGDLTFTTAGGSSPAINTPGDIVLIGGIKGSTGPAGSGIFFLGRDHTLQPVLLTGQELPGGGKAASSLLPAPSITDSGAVAFLAQRQDQSARSAYLWEQGTITPVLLAGTDVPGVGEIVNVSGVFANSKNRNVLVTARVSGSSGDGLYRVADGKILPVAVPGQEMPGGGKLKVVVPSDLRGSASISQASQAGEHAFWAKLEDGVTAAYRVDMEGKLSLVLKSGAATELGTITYIHLAPALNFKGQVALAAQIDQGPETIVLLTPAAP